MIPNQQNQKERKPETGSKMKKAHVIIPLIIVLMLMCIIPTIILILGVAFDRPTETAELDKNVEQGEEISAAIVASKGTITIEEDAIYLIKLHGGAGASGVVNAGKDNEYALDGYDGSLTTGYVYLSRGDVLTTTVYAGGGKSSSSYSTAGGKGISVALGKDRLGYVSGGPGAAVTGTRTVCAAKSGCTCNGETSFSDGYTNEFVSSVTGKSTASAGQLGNWKTINTYKSSHWVSDDKGWSDKEYTQSDQTYWSTGGGGGSVIAGGHGSYGSSAWESNPVITYKGNTYNLGSLCVSVQGGASAYTSEDELTPYMTVAKASLNLSIDPNGGTWNGSSSVTKKVGITGYTETISNPTRAGYTFTGWTVTGTGSKINGNQFTMGSQDATLKANWAATTSKYRVRHWKQNVDGNANEHNENNYTLADIEEKTIGLGGSVTPSVKMYEGFSSPKEQTSTVSANGNTIIDYYYTRKSYTLTLNKGTGIDTVTGGGTYLYGKLVTIDASVLDGFQWSDWSGIDKTDKIETKTYSFAMPAKDIVYIANGKPEEYTITYNLNDGIVTGNPDSYTPQTTSFTLVNPTRTGYTFTGWTGSNGETPMKAITITKGSTGNRNYVANWVANTNTPYVVRHWTQNIGGKVDSKNEQNYTMKEREDLLGTSDEAVKPNTRTYEGFTSPEIQTKTISADGTLIIDYYYTRNKYKVTLNKGQGVATVLGDGEYEYGQEVTINVMVKAGYDWVKWLGEDEELRDLKVTFTMPAKNVEYETVTMANPNTKYTIQHWKQKLGGKVNVYNEENYELATTDVLTGETDSMISPETRDYQGFKKPDADGISVPITGEGTLLIKYYYTRNSYEVKLNKGKGIEDIRIIGNITGEGKSSYLYQEEVTIEAKVKPGYTWDKWTGEQEIGDITHTFTMGGINVEYTANATPNSGTPYKVQHWQQNLTGNAEIHDNRNYTLIEEDTENLEGHTEEEITPRVNQYAGFTSPNPEKVIILADGSLVVNYYYTRNTTTPYKVEHWLQRLGAEREPQNEQNYTKTEIEELEGTTGLIITPETKEYAGFMAPQRQTVEIAGEGNLVVKYYYTRNTNTSYKVKHWVQKLEGMPNSHDDVNYELRDTDNLQGTTGESITPEVKEYVGFTAPYTQTTIIEGNGTTEINYYYIRNSYTITLNRGQGIENVIGANLYLYEQNVEIDAVILPGYTWDKWTGSNEKTTQNYRFVMPAENLEYTATSIPNIDTPYKVQHWKQDVEGNAGIKDEDNYTLIDTDELTGTTGENVTPETKEYAGFITPQKKTAKILGNGGLIVNYYYTRKTDLAYTVKYIDKTTGIVLEEKTVENQTYEKEISAEEEKKEFQEYIYESSEPEILKIGLGENIINIYYVKKAGKVIVHHYIYDEKEDKYTTTKIVADEEITGELGDEYTTKVARNIPENYVVVNETPEGYEGIIEEGTKEINYYYKLKKPDVGSDVEGGITSGGKQDEDGKWEIKAGEEVKYKVKYKTEIEDYKGKIKIEVRAKLPEGTRINTGKSDFAGGEYNRETNTIKWTKEIENINTFENGAYTEEIIKDITIVYAEHYVLESIELDITGKTILYYPTSNPGEEDKPLVEDETDENGKVIVHHYIYDIEEDKYTTHKLAEDEEIIKKVGSKYTTYKSTEIGENYKCISEQPEGYKGEITKETIEVNYYYKLEMPETDNKTDTDIVEGGKQDEEGNWVITAGDTVKYKISYESKIRDYKGKATIEIKAKLPEGTKMDYSKSKLSGGIYNQETNTITWTKEIEGINTFKDGEYVEKINKQISVVYAEDCILEDIKLNITGNTKLYYPEDYIEKGEDTTIGGGRIVVHHYIYDEKNNQYTTTKLVEDEELMKKIGDEYTTSKSKDIPENYICINDKPEGYKGKVTKEPIEVNYYYKLKTPTIDTSTGGELAEGGNQREDGKWEIKAGEEIKYTISYKTEIEDYKGKAKVEIKAKLPEGTTIDQENCNFAEGTYDEETNTVNWTKEIEGIDTFTNGAYTETITKDITIVYAEDYVVDEITPKVTGKTTLYSSDGKDDLIVDESDGNGKVVIHHYIYDEKTNTYTTEKLVENEQIKGEIGTAYETKPSENIPSNYECINRQPEGYIGIYAKETIKVDYYYKLKTPTTEGEAGGELTGGGQQTEDGKFKVKEGEEIEYKVSYKTKIVDYKGKATIEMKAKLPAGTGIDLRKSNLADGKYDIATNTVNWVKEIEEIDTFANGEYTEEITKNLTIVYDNDYVLEDMDLEVKGKTTLYYPDDYPTEGDGTLTEDETKGEGKVIVHHYIYDEEENIYTTERVTPDENVKGKIGEEYTTSKSSEVPKNYECINEQPEGYTGTITKEAKEVSYYYKLKTPTVEGEAGGEITGGGKQDEEGNWEIKAGEEIKYKVSYKVKILDYKGKAKIEITAKLPEGTEINERKCDLAEGTYDKETNTVSWTKEIEEIDTFTNGEYTEEITKDITIVYDKDYKLEDIRLEVKGNTMLYYPDNYPVEKDEPFIKDETREKGKVLVHHYIYDEKDNKYTEAKIAEDEEIIGEIGENYETKPSEKVPSNYECINEKPEGHTGTIEKKTKEINYYYKLKATKTEGNGNSNIITDIEKDKEGNWVIKVGEEIEYEVKYEVKIEDYIGKATIKVKAELPKGTKIDLDKSDLNGGRYEEAINTITWTKEVENIDTFVNGAYAETITKNIKIVYAENYTLEDANLKITGNIITYYPDDYPEKGGETLPDNNQNENPEDKMGKVIVRYVDVETEEGAYEYEITGKIGEPYETKEKEIKYYVLVRSEGNTKGEITEQQQVVTYYYRKLNFNIGIEKTIDTITLNGTNIKIDNNKTSKLEITKDDIKKTDLIVKYNLKVTNTGELGGTSKVLEQIPEGYELAYLPEYWRVNRDGSLETSVDLEAGESKNLDVVLRWENEENNLGAKTNIAKIEKAKNEAGFKDTNEKDNIGEATIVLSIKTGETVSNIIIVMLMGSLVICSYITIRTIRRKDPEIKDIKFLK